MTSDKKKYGRENLTRFKRVLRSRLSCSKQFGRVIECGYVTNLDIHIKCYELVTPKNLALRGVTYFFLLFRNLKYAARFLLTLLSCFDCCFFMKNNTLGILLCTYPFHGIFSGTFGTK